MKKGMKYVTLAAFIWVMYANFHLLSAAASTIANFNKTITVKQEMQQYCLCLKLEWTSEEKIPRNPWSLIRSYLEADNKEIPKRFGKDVWGKRYRLFPGEGEIYMISAGPDKRFKNKDDIKFTQVLPGFTKNAIVDSDD